MAETVLHAGHGVPRHIDWRAGVYAGLIAGVVFLILEMGMVWLFMGESPWAPPRMIAAMVLGEGVLPIPPDKPATFSLGVVTTAMVIHFILSIVYGVIGAGCGLVIYLVNFYPIANALFPWFAMARNWISIFAHIVFGAVVGAAYVGWQRPASAQA